MGLPLGVRGDPILTERGTERKTTEQSDERQSVAW